MMGDNDSPATMFAESKDSGRMMENFGSLMTRIEAISFEGLGGGPPLDSAVSWVEERIFRTGAENNKKSRYQTDKAT
jgi:hypothetical protein